MKFNTEAELVSWVLLNIPGFRMRQTVLEYGIENSLVLEPEIVECVKSAKIFYNLIKAHPICLN